MPARTTFTKPSVAYYRALVEHGKLKEAARYAIRCVEYHDERLRSWVDRHGEVEVALLAGPTPGDDKGDEARPTDEVEA